MSTRPDRIASKISRTRHERSGDSETVEEWWHYNRFIRCYGVPLLIGTKLADVITTAVGLRYLPAIAEANPIANHLFAQWGLYTGMAVLGAASVAFAAGAAEVFGLEVRRRYGLPKTALFAQASIYLTLSVLFGVVAVHNGLLIADQTTHAVDALVGFGG